MELTPYLLLLMSAIGALILLMVGWAVGLLKKIGETQTAQSIAIAELRALLLGVNGTPGLISRVNDLHVWRNKMQEQELADVHAEVDRLHEERRINELPGRRANDR